MEHAQEDDEELAKELFTVLAAAGEAFSRQRAEEGGRLEADILAKLEELDRDVAYIEMRAPQIIEEYKSRLLAKVKETLADAAADEARIMTEVVLYADRVCVDEETVRLKRGQYHPVQEQPHGYHRGCHPPEDRHRKDPGTGAEHRINQSEERR